jgi:eukaryotic translation initiation factor 2C
MESMNFRSYTPETDMETFQVPTNLPLRPGTNTAGKSVQIRVNQFKVTQWPTKDVYQFDVRFSYTSSILGDTN